ncbi:MAG: DUF2088 domain-containing protein [Spirochaetales bacterium]|nr:DUF2088 domain-containing protein [Spirochaetales bacterium]
MTPVASLLKDVQIPRMIPIRQIFDRDTIKNPGDELLAKMLSAQVSEKVLPGMNIAIAVGSRGIENQPLFVKLIVETIKNRGGSPFLFPAMGSHGGATADGQRSMLEGMGFTEEYIGAPIRATMEVNQIGVTDSSLPVYLDKFANQADGIVLINRIKPHVGFRGPYESGLMKMLSIGVGKQRGAETCHNLGFGAMAENIPAIANVVIEKKNIMWSVGVLENAYHETCRIEILEKKDIAAKEPLLLETARTLSPRLHIESLDALILDEIGKDISGTGFDNNILGRYHTPYVSGGPTIRRIAVLDLTAKSHGNANGLGILDFTTKRLFDKIDFDQTYPNSLTSTVPLSVKIPMVLDNDLQAIQAAIKTCNIPDKSKVRLMRIKNTLKLDEIEVSVSLLEDAQKHSQIEIVGEAGDLLFDQNGNLF